MLKVIVAATAIMLPGAALAEDWGRFYAEIYGGAVVGTTTNLTGWIDLDYAMRNTWAGGAAVGVDFGNGFSLGLDVMKTGQSVFEVHPDSSMTAFSVMAEGEYQLALNDTFAVYGALGLGAIQLGLAEVGVGSNSLWGAGYSAGVGVRAEVTDNLAVFAEFKRQDLFAGVELDNNEWYKWATNTALVGVRLSM